MLGRPRELNWRACLIKAYVNERLSWLAHHRIRILRATVYRMNVCGFDQPELVAELPLVIRGGNQRPV
jgi:hypothetical protein